MDTLLKDVRYSFRRMLRSPGFTVIALLSLAVGIGTNTAVFTLVEGFLFPSLPYEAPEELVDVYVNHEVFAYSPLSYPDYLDLREATKEVFSEIGLGGYGFGQVDKGDQVTTLMGEMVSGTWFPTLGLDAALGRTLLPEDDVSPGAHYVVMLTHGYWEREYAADPGVIGQTLVLSGHGYTIVGVAPEDYPGIVLGVPVDFIAPIAMSNQILQGTSDQLANRSNYSDFVKARLRPGISLEQAGVALSSLAADLRQNYPEEWSENQTFIPVPTEDVIMNPVFDRVLLPASVLALVLVGVVLLIACANLASFLLARGTDRKKEIAMRLALGARRGILVRQLLTETTVLGIGGGILGMGVSAWLLHALVSLDLPLPGDVRLELGMTGRGYLFGLGVTLVTGLLFGLAPALQSTKPDVAPTLKDESTGGGKPRRLTLRNVLVSGQVAASLFLLISAGLFLRSFQARQSVDPGFGREPTALLSFVVSSERYDEEEGRVFVREYLARLNQLPEVVAAGAAGNFHLTTTSTNTMDLNVDGVEPPPGARSWGIDETVVNPEFFAAAGIPLLRGRNFLDTDFPEGIRVAIVNEVFAERFWPGQDPIGKVIRRESGQELEVVGVARSTKVRTLGEPPRPFVYTPYSQRYAAYLTAVIQTRGRPEAILQTAFRTLREMDPEMVVTESKTMEEHLGVQLMPARLGALMASVFAIVALALASIGLYGIVSYAVSRRSREMGIRMSLGAAPGTVVRQVVREGMVLVGAGTGLGLALALAGAQVLRSLLYGIGALDPVTFVGVPLLLLAVTLGAAYLPARRASRVDPVRALKAE
ncbi:MAG: ABC transporter permease [Longimicrobiales bacterium]